ncbi:unnamed protein product [Acanthoscelides obtectus]|uniref:Transposase n=1 Tax=Acanthoscelides obtectus TaxID=200917 RepID=A0A9P0KCM8_ACAOB|nr:unnamed protein product [Acanthoscelides obtectus]CAK1673425.1 Histone-lysine N-methyltransferase SETMAR [Acanthoscelides obtectus]
MTANERSQLSQQECLAELLSVFGNEAPHQSTISRWYGEFKRGRVITQGNVDAVRKLIIEDRHVTYREIEASLKTLVSRWIPHLLTEEQNAARVNWFICSRSVSKKMVATFVSKAGHIATIPLNEQSTLQKMNPERRIILHQDNASSHTAQKTRQYLTEENVELLDHLPYSPDLSPNAFFTFPKIKNRLRGQKFQSPEEAVYAFRNAVLDVPANEWNKCFENWFLRMQMCINLRGEYFEKQ